MTPDQRRAALSLQSEWEIAYEGDRPYLRRRQPDEPAPRPLPRSWWQRLVDRLVALTCAALVIAHWAGWPL